MEDDTSAKKYMHRPNNVISNLDLNKVKNLNLSWYYMYRGLYYSNYSYEKAIKDFEKLMKFVQQKTTKRN